MQNKEADSTAGSSSKHRGSEGIPIESASNPNIAQPANGVNLKPDRCSPDYSKISYSEITDLQIELNKRENAIRERKQEAIENNIIVTQHGPIHL